MPASLTPWWHLFIPKLYTTLREGYGPSDFRSDALAGLTVAIVAVPLAMALAIASGTTPEKGLITAIIAGFLISCLGGSRVQIGGPTGAFVVVVFDVIARYGYDGLITATFMAGIMLLVAGFCRFGTWIKYIPQPVITGFTAGIAVIIFSSQVRDIFGLEIEKVPGAFIEKWEAFWSARDSFNIYALLISLAALAVIIVLRKYAPKFPAFLVAVLGASIAVFAFKIPVSTIGTEFGGIPTDFPVPSWPVLSVDRMRELLPSAFTIAFLAGIESLLSAVVADGLIARRHRSNCELVAQGVANTASALFGGMPATGAIARTVTNIRSGGRTPVAGMMHAVFVLLIMMIFAPLAVYVPLSALAAILVIVAWNMSEQDKIRHLWKAPLGDKLVLVVTFALTVLVDLTVAIEIGVVLGAILFMHRMAETVQMQTHTPLIQGDQDEFYAHSETGHSAHEHLPKHVEAYQIQGPLFFGAASRLMDVLDQITQGTKIFILRMGQVPLIDASGEDALATFISRCKKKGVYVIVSNLQPQPRKMLERMGLLQDDGHDVLFVEDFRAAVMQADKRLMLTA